MTSSSVMTRTPSPTWLTLGSGRPCSAQKAARSSGKYAPPKLGDRDGLALCLTRREVVPLLEVGGRKRPGRHGCGIVFEGDARLPASNAALIEAEDPSHNSGKLCRNLQAPRPAPELALRLGAVGSEAGVKGRLHLGGRAAQAHAPGHRRCLLDLQPARWPCTSAPAPPAKSTRPPSRPASAHRAASPSLRSMCPGQHPARGPRRAVSVDRCRKAPHGLPSLPSNPTTVALDRPTITELRNLVVKWRCRATMPTRRPGRAARAARRGRP
jgi:hypothetical protein